MTNRFPLGTSVRKTFFAAVGALALMMGSRALAVDVNFKLHNLSGSDIVEIYVAKVGSNSWGVNTIQGKYVPHGKSLPIHFRQQETSLWNLRVVLRNRKATVWRNNNLNNVTGLTFFYKDGKPASTWKRRTAAAPAASNVIHRLCASHSRHGAHVWRGKDGRTYRCPGHK